jgi:hypothetical protein
MVSNSGNTCIENTCTSRIHSNRILAVFALMAAVIMVMTFALAIVTTESHAAGVTIGQATNGEGGKLRGCSAGDQSGKEVSLGKWGYGGGAYHWQYVFRAKDPSVGKKLAENMKAAAANNHIGYDQNTPDRYSFYDAAKACGWDISAISTNCETTCASAVSVCINAAGITVPRYWDSGRVYSDIMATGEFDVFTSSDYTASSANLLPGDILLSPGTHTAMVVDSPNPFMFDVSYEDENGEVHTDKVEEGKEIQLNLNNGSGVESVEVSDKVDLNEYAPKKTDQKFKGWKQNGENNFSAEYESSVAAIATNSKKRSLD